MMTYIIKRTERQEFILAISARSESEALARAQVGHIEQVVQKESVTVRESTDVSEVQLLSVEPE